MNSLWLTMFVVAVCALLYVLLKPRATAGSFLRFVANVALAGVMVYAIQLTGLLGDVELALNIPNVLLVGLLGLPGLALLYGLHLFVFV